MRLPADQWVEILHDAIDEFEADGASAVFSTCRVEEDDPLDIDDIEITDGKHARAGRLALNARMTDVRATQLLAALPEGNFILRLKFLREKDDDWALEDKSDPVRTERKRGQRVIEISRDTKPGVLTGIDSVFYQNAYPVTAVAYGLYPIRDPDPANRAPLRDGDLNCMAQRVVEHFEGVLRGQGLTPTENSGRKYRGGRREFTKAVQSLTKWLNWKRPPKQQSSCEISPVKTSTAENTSAVNGRQ